MRRVYRNEIRYRVVVIEVFFSNIPRGRHTDPGNLSTVINYGLRNSPGICTYMDEVNFVDILPLRLFYLKSLPCRTM